MLHDLSAYLGHEMGMEEFVLAETQSGPKFGGQSNFHREIKRRVSAYFEQSGLSQRDNLRMYLKTVLLLIWFAGTYAILVFFATTWWQGLLLSFSLALAMAGIGFGVQHDANHGAYSSKRVVNRLMGMTLDLLGASSYVWKWKHNICHHTYTNVDGADDDIELRPFGRLAPTQPHHRFHQFQHVYLWFLYCFIHPYWQVGDFTQIIRAKVAKRRIPRPRNWDLFQLVTGKALFLTWVFVIPMFFHPWWLVLLFYFVTAMVLGLCLSVVFQLAHCVEEANFPKLESWSDRLPHSWAEHQVQTTVNFVQNNRLLTWYLGGLNFQIEHHLLPRICHVHYPKIAKIVRATCEEYGIRYTAQPKLFTALSSHWRWLRRMGNPHLEARGAS